MTTQGNPETKQPYQRPDNLKENLAGLFKHESTRIVMLGLNQNNHVSVQSAGPVSTQDVLIMAGTAFAHAYAELPMDQQRNMPFNQFLNNLAMFSAAYLHQISPQSPTFFMENLPASHPEPPLHSDEDELLEQAAEAAREEHTQDLQQEETETAEQESLDPTPEPVTPKTPAKRTRKPRRTKTPAK